MKKFLASVIRHLLTTSGGWFIANGIVDQAGMVKIVDSSETIAGVLMVAAALAWSFIEKKFFNRK